HLVDVHELEVDHPAPPVADRCQQGEPVERRVQGGAEQSFFRVPGRHPASLSTHGTLDGCGAMPGYRHSGRIWAYPASLTCTCTSIPSACCARCGGCSTVRPATAFRGRSR